MGRVCMGRVCYGPSLSWAEFVMGRVVQLPFIHYPVTKNKPIYHVRVSKQMKGRAFSVLAALKLNHKCSTIGTLK